jgi:single-stranded-DNA-specific exonuclease
MLSLQSRVWDIQNIFTNESADDFRKGLNIGRISSKLLMSRNYSDIENAAELINTDEGSFFDPFLLPDMEKAARFILEMINNKKKILIYGDYDVDGITSTSVLYLFLKKYSENIEFYIPDRIEDGYGLSVSAIDYLKKNIKPDLIITVDCGAVSFYEAEYIKELGISLIITDHHECTSEMPAAVAVINPNRYDSKYPNSNLAGVGVALKLVQAIGSLKGNENDFYELC